MGPTATIAKVLEKENKNDNTRGKQHFKHTKYIQVAEYKNF